MEYRRLGNSGLMVSVLTMGTMTFGGKGNFAKVGNLQLNEVRKLIDIVADAGVNLIDTANVYSGGASEELIGEAMGAKRKPGMLIATKARYAMGEGPNDRGLSRWHLIRECEASLKRLKTDVIDLYYIHRVDPTVPIEDTIGAMSELVREGKVRFLGICEAGAATIRRAHAVHPLAALQIEYSLWTRDVESEIVPLCEALGIGFVAYSPLGRGLLTGSVMTADAFGASDVRRNMPRFQGDNLRRNLLLVEELKAHAQAENCTPAQLALAWLLAQKPFVVPIPGTSHVRRLEENAAAAALSLSADTAEVLARVFPPGAAAGLRYPESHLARLGI